MTKIIRLILAMSLAASLSYAAAPMETSVGWKYRLGPVGRHVVLGAFLGVHLGYNAMAGIFQIMQMATLPKMVKSLPDNEDGVALEDRRCGIRCMDNSARYRDYAESVINLDMAAMVATAVSAMSNMAAVGWLTAAAFNWGNQDQYHTNLMKFTHIAIGASVFNSVFDLASTGMLVKLATTWREGIPLPTLGKLQMAIADSIAYMAPSVPFLVFGVVKLSTIFNQLMWPTVTAADSAA